MLTQLCLCAWCVAGTAVIEIRLLWLLLCWPSGSLKVKNKQKKKNQKKWKRKMIKEKSPGCFHVCISRLNKNTQRPDALRSRARTHARARAHTHRKLGWKHTYSTDCKTENHSGERRTDARTKDTEQRNKLEKTDGWVVEHGETPSLNSPEESHTHTH